MKTRDRKARDEKRQLRKTQTEENKKLGNGKSHLVFALGQDRFSELANLPMYLYYHIIMFHIMTVPFIHRISYMWCDQAKSV